MREATIRGSARTYYDLMSPSERRDVVHLIRRLESDPSPDQLSIFDVPEVPGLLLFDDGTWQILYRVPDEATVVVLSIAHALDLPL